MEIKLLSLTLKNFKGIGSFELDVDGNDAIVYGRNGAGKSTLVDALAWLLFDKDAGGNSKFSIKTLDADSQELHNLEHEVTAILDVDGRGVVLTKTMVEKWIKKRGSSAPEFSGHETTYYIDEVPKKKGEYDDYVAGLVREDLFMMLISVTHFNAAMKWQDRRALLLEVAGDVSDADVIASSEDLARVPEVLGGRSYDDAKAVLKAQRPKVAKEIDEIGPRIDEAERSRPAAGSMVPPTTGKTYTELKTDLERLRNERAALLAGDTSSAQTEILKLRERMSKLDDKYRKAMQARDEEVRVFAVAAAKAGAEMERIERAQGAATVEIAAAEPLLAALRAEYAELKARKEPEAVCVTCGQELPADQAEEIRAAFRGRTALAIEKNVARGQEVGKKIKALKESLASLEEAHAKALEEQELAEEAFAAFAKPEAPDHSQTLSVIEGIEADISSKAAPDTTKIDGQMAEIRAAIEQQDDAAMARESAARADKRIAELKAQQKDLGKELDRIDRDIMLLEGFLRVKVGMLEQGVAARFAPLSFRLFQEQINGGLRETCETLVPSPEGAMVPWSDVNTGHKILAGLRIIEVLGKHYGITAPVCIDNAESLTEAVPEIGSQIIKLVASEAHVALTVEVDRAEKEVAA
jgi:DNA repair exonuclease SbcCD ATPase subunit